MSNSARPLFPLLLLLGLAALPACAKDFFLASPAIEGQVVEVGTDKPIPGVIVVVRWQGHVGWTGTVCFHVETAISDGNGIYRIPAWHKPSPYGDVRGAHYPVAYKPGYEDTVPVNDTVRLKPFTGTRGERLGYLSRVSSATRCGESGASEKNILPLKKLLYEEARSIATTAEDQDKVETLLFGLESLEFGSIEALNRMTERRKVKK